MCAYGDRQSVVVGARRYAERMVERACTLAIYVYIYLEHFLCTELAHIQCMYELFELNIFFEFN